MIDMKKCLAIGCACICFMSAYAMDWQGLDTQKKEVGGSALSAIKNIQSEAQAALEYAALHPNKESIVPIITQSHIKPMSTLQESITQLLKEFKTLKESNGDKTRGQQIVASIGTFAEQLKALQSPLTTFVDKLAIAVNKPRNPVQPPAGPQPGQVQPGGSATAAPAGAVEAVGQTLIQLAEQFSWVIGVSLGKNDTDRRKMLVAEAFLFENNPNFVWMNIQKAELAKIGAEQSYKQAYGEMMQKAGQQVEALMKSDQAIKAYINSGTQFPLVDRYITHVSDEFGRALDQLTKLISVPK